MTEAIEYKRISVREEAAVQIINKIKNFSGDQFYVMDDALSYLRGIAGHYAFGAYKNDELVAVIFGRLLDHTELSYYRRFVSDFLLDDLLEDFFNKKGGAINVFVVDPEYIENVEENDFREIIAELAKMLMDTLSQTAEVVFVDLTVNDDNILYKTWLDVLVESNFKEFGIIDDFWKDYSENREEAICPKCGDICHCQAHILYKRV